MKTHDGISNNRAVELAIARHLRAPSQITVDPVVVAELQASMDASARRVLQVFGNVESDAILQLSHAMHLGLSGTPILSEFLTKWGYEEAEHGRAFRALAGCQDSDSELDLRALAAHRKGFGRLHSLGRHLAYAGSGVLPYKHCVYSAFGAIQESTVLRAYILLRKLLPTPSSQAIVGQIIRQESQHLSVYTSCARTILLGNVTAQRFVRGFLKSLWKPVGFEAMGEARFNETIMVLCRTPADVEFLSGSDVVLDALPGLGGMNLMRITMERIMV